MADILPIDTELDDIVEGDPTSITFSGDLSATETVKSIEITNYTPNSGITIVGNSFSGSYQDSFTLDGSGAIQYRNTVTQERISVDKFEDLPTDPSLAHVFSCEFPSPLTQIYNYEVTMVYETTDPDGILPPVEDTLIKTYSQLVSGNYTIWADQLTNYIAGGA